MSAPVEFDTDPEFILRDHGSRTTAPGSPVSAWSHKISIDLRWVASAKPWNTFACITMAGSNERHYINIDYYDFMQMWTNHMERRTT